MEVENSLSINIGIPMMTNAMSSTEFNDAMSLDVRLRSCRKHRNPRYINRQTQRTKQDSN